MRYYQAPHEVTDEGKFAAMVEVLRNGGSLPPVVVEPNEQRALCGSHRIAAWVEAGVSAEALVLTDDQYLAACEYLNVEYLDEVSDYDDICFAIYQTCGDEDIRAALADQIGGSAAR